MIIKFQFQTWCECSSLLGFEQITFGTVDDHSVLLSRLPGKFPPDPAVDNQSDCQCYQRGSSTVQTQLILRNSNSIYNIIFRENRCIFLLESAPLLLMEFWLSGCVHSEHINQTFVYLHAIIQALFIRKREQLHVWPTYRICWINLLNYFLCIHKFPLAPFQDSDVIKRHITGLLSKVFTWIIYTTMATSTTVVSIRTGRNRAVPGGNPRPSSSLCQAWHIYIGQIAFPQWYVRQSFWGLRLRNQGIF